jgi:hypothetical protein
MALAATAALVAILATEAPTSAQTDRHNAKSRLLDRGERTGGTAGNLSATQKRAMNQGYLVPDQAAYGRAKARAAQEAASRAREAGRKAPSSSAPSALAPSSFRSWQGPNDTTTAPSDSTGAIGPSRYVELVNSKYAVYNRTSNTPIVQGTLNDLATGGDFPLDSVFDPQVIWDPSTQRFYYAADDVTSATENYLAVGFSKDATPDGGPSDWCNYYIPYGADFPDYPKLGDTANFVMIGANDFTSTGGFQADLAWVGKPPAGTTCPSGSTLNSGVKQDLRNANGTQAFTPVPANQTDTSATGYVVAEPSSIFGGGGASSLSLFKVGKNADGSLNLGAARNVSVPSYDLPANAPQKGTTKVLDTLDARNTQAVLAKDPSRGTNGLTALWTQHTVFGGAGAQVRWYEINPAGPSLFQRGTVTGTPTNGIYDFNGAVSPDRKVSATTSKFGQSMVLGYNSSSTTTFASIRMASKVGSNAASSGVLVKASSASLQNFDCSDPNHPGVCRWGDYSGATPDPASPSTGAHGQVWLTNQWVRNAGTASSSGWGSWNWAAKP